MAVETSSDPPEPQPAAQPSPPRPRITRRTVISWIAGFVVVLVILELGLRAGSSQLSDPVDYINTDAQSFVHDMNVLKAAHVRSDLTFVGNSLVRRDIDAAKFEGQLPGVDWAHNVAIGGFDMPTTRRWLLEEVVPRLQPKRVVLGLSSWDFNAGRAPSTRSIQDYDKARATKPGVLGDLNRGLEASALSKYRDDLRNPYGVLQDAQGKATHVRTGGTLRSRAKWKLGYPATTPAQLARARRQELRDARAQQLVDFHIGTDEMQSYLDTLTTLHSKGIAVAVVLMPVSSQYIASHPRGQADFDDWKHAVTDAAQSRHVTVLDLSRSMPDDDFRDYEHLNVPPAEQFTTLLLGRLHTLGW